MLVGALVLGGFWALVIVLTITGRRLSLALATLALLALLLVALALQPHVHAAGWVALVATVLLVAVLYARPGSGADD
jgi:hypothetical protein